MSKTERQLRLPTGRLLVYVRRTGAGDSKPIFCSWLAQMGDRRPTTALRPAWFTDASGHLAPSERRSCQDGQDNGRQCHHAFISIIALTRCTPSRDRIASVALQRSV